MPITVSSRDVLEVWLAGQTGGPGEGISQRPPHEARANRGNCGTVRDTVRRWGILFGYLVPCSTLSYIHRRQPLESRDFPISPVPTLNHLIPNGSHQWCRVRSH